MTKRCPRLNHDVPIEEFGINRSVPDGRNTYCLTCNRERMRESRELKRRMTPKQPRIKKTIPITVLVEKVLRAIEQGNRTWNEIKTATCLPDDAISEASAVLVGSRAIKPYQVDGQRAYEPVVDRKPCVKTEFKKALSFVAIAASAHGFR